MKLTCHPYKEAPVARGIMLQRNPHYYNVLCNAIIARHSLKLLLGQIATYITLNQVIYSLSVCYSTVY